MNEELKRILYNYEEERYLLQSWIHGVDDQANGVRRFEIENSTWLETDE